jgi:hypothetical protein
VFVAAEMARDAVELARQMERGETKAATVAWGTENELAPDPRAHVPEDEAGERPSRRADAADPREIVVASMRDSTPPAEPLVGEKEQAAPEILIPAYADPSGRDCLGRWLDANSIAVAVAANRAVNGGDKLCQIAA